MKVKKKVSLFITIVICLISVMSVAVFAEHTGYITVDGVDKAAYNYDMSYSWWPWSDVKAYSNTSFIVPYDVIKAGFTAYSSVSLTGTESNPATISKTVPVGAGTNYARTGNISLDGHRRDAYSEHRSVYSAEGVRKYMKLVFND